MKPSETIFNGKSVAIPMADVQHIEKNYKRIYDEQTGQDIGTDYQMLVGVTVITDKTKWSFEHDCWENAIWLSECNGSIEASNFLKAWCNYRAEIDGVLD